MICDDCHREFASDELSFHYETPEGERHVHGTCDSPIRLDPETLRR
ncbi:hypothetical protein SEA_BOBBY_182 [Mycobacterium phage Bobby]|nr:hypothetical protein SEA_BOBBY_182 [Mycobacterium phage Bobby]